METLIAVACLILVIVLAMYWTLWKVRGELGQSQQKMISELSEIRKLLEKTADKG